MYKQLIIIRKDLNMSVGKMAGQVAHASNMYFLNLIKSNSMKDKKAGHKIQPFTIDDGIYDEWINDIYTKIICGAKNKGQLLKAATIANELGLEENTDYFVIKDRCLTELEPEEIDENGIGYTVTAIGFRPLPNEVVSQISKKYQLLNGQVLYL